jgi:hypothetical protein
LVSVPRLVSPFIVALRERGPTAIHDRRPQSGRVSDRETDPEIRPEEITFLAVLGARIRRRRIDRIIVTRGADLYSFT